MSNSMHVKNLTVFDCTTVQIKPDLENGCLEIICYDDSGKRFQAFQILVYGVDDTVPGIDLAEPERSEAELDNVASFADGA